MYRLKPLEWRGNEHKLLAKTPFGFAQVNGVPEGGFEVHFAGGGYAGCDPLEHGKQLAEEHWRERVLPMLEPVDLDDPETLLHVVLDRLEEQVDERVRMLRAILAGAEADAENFA